MKINFHINEVCNMNCQYCIRNNKSIKHLSSNWKKCIDIIAHNPNIDFINIAGGEPTINKKLLIQVLKYIKLKGLKSSIISNGFMFIKDDEFLKQVLEYVEWIGISVDSLNHTINKFIGRSVSGKTLNFNDIKKIEETVHQYDKQFKINIVFSNINRRDETLLQLKEIKNDKLKILKNQHDKNLTIEDCLEFKNKFIDSKKINDIKIEYDMGDSYIMINGNLEVYSRLNEIPKSIFNSNLDEIINRLKNSNNYKQKDINYKV